MARPTEQQVAELKLQFPDRELLLLTSQNAAVVAKVPGLVEVTELRNRIDDPKRKPSAMDWFVRSCVVWPALPELNALLQRRPLLVEKWYQQLENEAGAAEQVEVGKL